MCGNLMRLLGLQEASWWGKFQVLLYWYIDYAQPLNVFTRYADQVHTPRLAPGYLS